LHCFNLKTLLLFADECYLTNGYLDTVIDWIPGMNHILLRDLPTYVQTTDPNDVMFKFIVHAVETAPKASGIIIHTFDALEQEVLDALTPMFPRVYSIGPLQLLLNRSPNDPLKSIGYSLWEEETESLFGNLFWKQVFCFQNIKTCLGTVDWRLVTCFENKN
jgi:hypothetical protein